MSDYLQLPQRALDPGFQDRIGRLRNIEGAYGRDSVQWRALLAKPWVKSLPYSAQTATHCPHGHSHDAEVVGPVRHEDQPHIRRQCRHCPDWWLEPLTSML